MKYFAEMIITPRELRDCKILQKNIMLQRTHDVLITGTLLNIECEPIQDAVIVINRINCSDQVCKQNLGYAITNQKGQFAIVIEKRDDINYQLDIYEPMII